MLGCRGRALLSPRTQWLGEFLNFRFSENFLRIFANVCSLKGENNGVLKLRIKN